MPISIKYLKENVEKVKDSQKKRFDSVEFIDEILALDEKVRGLKRSTEQRQQKINSEQKKIGLLKRAKKHDEAKVIIDSIADLKKKQVEEKKILSELQKEFTEKFNTIGNIVDDGAYVAKKEDNNPVVDSWGKKLDKQEDKKDFKFETHDDLLYMIGGYNFESAQKIAGNRAYYLTGPGVLLNMALQQYGIKFLAEKGYTAVQPPFFMYGHVMGKTAQLEDFQESLYKVGGDDEKNEKYLIATSEQPISAMHMDKWLEPETLPYKYAGVSTCFRKEAGSATRDNWGIFRVHQFEKIEQFVVCDPKDSPKEFKKLIDIAAEFYQSLGLPYRVVNIASGSLNKAAAIKYDLEGYFPGLGKYRELVSCSNCTDYQSRAMETRFGLKKKDDKDKVYVHMLNSTLCATGRVICSILENGQTEKGINVPEVLHPFVGKFLPFIREKSPHKELEQKRQQKAANKNKAKNKKKGGKKKKN